MMVVGLASLAVTACSSGAPASPAPAPTKAAAPAEPVEATKAPASQLAAAPQPTADSAKKVDFPAKGKAVTLLVPFAAGGSTDVAYRLLAPLMEKELGAPVEVVNKPGASTQLAMTDLATAKPDGYTLGSITLMTTIVTYLDPDRKAIYTRKDFQPVAHFTGESNLVVVKADSPFKDIKDLVDASKANPEKVKVGTSGLMGNTHLGMLMLENAAKVKFAFVHFDGNAPALTALLGGHVDVLCISTGAVLPHYKSGDVRVLGVLDKEESKFFPGVKTLAAQGYDAVTVFSYGLAAPAGTPREVVDTLSSSVKKAMASDELKRKLDEMALVPNYMGPDEFEKYWAEMEARVKPLMELVKK